MELMHHKNTEKSLVVCGKMKTQQCLFMCLLIVVKQCLSQESNCTSAGDPLILTPFIANGSITQAQQLALVTPSIANVTSYAGLLTVNKTCNSNIFFWLVLAKENWETAPLTIWLQGGPGSSSMYGCFEELGPWTYINGSLNRREYSWHNLSNLLFIDQPVGSGYSYTNNVTECYPKNLTEVGRDLYEAIIQFFQIFPMFVQNNNSLFLTGESYAGHWLPALCHTIIQKNVNASLKINITAILIGGAWIHPLIQCIYSEFLFNIALYDRTDQLLVEQYEQDFLDYMSSGDYANASVVCNAQLGGIYDGLVGKVDVYNYVKLVNDEGNYMDFVQSCDIRKAIHVGNSTFQSGNEIYASLTEDLVYSVKPWVEEALENGCPVILMNGQLDIIGAACLMERTMNNFTWSGQDTYLNATKNKWCVDGILAGYFKGVDRLHHMTIRSAGHYLPKDQAAWLFLFFKSILNIVVSNSPFTLLETCDTTT